MDGHFVPNLTIGPGIVAAVARVTRCMLDVHLMVTDPDSCLDAFIDAGAQTVAVHVEACTHLDRTLARIRERGARTAVALNPATPVESLRPVLGQIDQVLVMSVNPGFGGQRFIRSTLDKIYALRRAIDLLGRPVEIVVDGGIGLDNVEEVAQAGARTFVMGSSFYGSGDYKRFVDSVRARLAPYTRDLQPRSEPTPR
jgi:ribulose-phosphate 3-epimerase